MFHQPETVDFYFSYRSPYSYLAAPRVFRLPERFRVAVRWRGVLPMVERGETLSQAKSLHILRDCRREAKRLRMRFGPMRDPLGAGVHRCLAITERAQQLGLEVAPLVLRLSRAIWAEAADVCKDDVLESLVRSAGLSWSQLRGALADESLTKVFEDNRVALAEAGHWGVPTLVYRTEPFWGQDRIDDLELSLGASGLLSPRGHLATRTRRL